MDRTDRQREEAEDDDAAPPTASDGEHAPTLYVGLGASAGGLEALREFLGGMSPTSGIAFIVVQHLSPDHKSLMDELLARNTSMPVESVSDGVRVRPDTVYLIPPRRDMTLADGCLRLHDQRDDEGVNLPIDRFFRSLAEEAGERSAAIVLSGTGSDGSRGLRAVKEAGGLVLVQDPDSAKFDGMPWSAVRTGLADLVLEPSRIGEYLEGYVRHPLVRGEAGRLRERLENDEAVLQDIFELLRKHSRIDFSHYKPSTVARRIERRMGVSQVQELHAYLALLQRSEQEIETLARELLINVTRFFRDAEAFEFLEREVVPALFRNRGGDDIRVWVAGCSSGEEAYSIAILLDEARRRLAPETSVKLFATDIDAEAIAEASHARYGPDIEGDVSAERLARHFERRGDEYAVRQEIRQMVVFATHNTISDPPFSNIDLISCRNALIYFRPPVQKKIIASFHFSLRREGVLFLGISESVGDLKTLFEPINERLRFFRKSGSLASGALGTTLRRTEANGKIAAGGLAAPLPPVASLLGNWRQTPRESPFDHVKDSLINDFVPACIVLDGEHHAVHLYGDANRYLTRFPSGRVSTRLGDIIAEELAVPLSTSLARARGEERAVHYADIPLTIDAREIEVDLRVEHFPAKPGKAAYSVVIISESGERPPDAARESYDTGSETRQRIRDLEVELLHKQEHLQVTNEELETTNEELQSANEELMSSNEELQSANEELQSVNEELYTVNNEYQEKITELSIANDDLDNVLSFTAIGIVFLDVEMRIRRFTAVATRYFNLLPSDVGRPLHHISNELEYPSLFADIESVNASGESLDRDVFTGAGEIVRIRLIPYQRTGEENGGARVSGVILTLTEASERLGRGYAAARASEPAADGERRSGRYRLLIVDDDESDRLLLRRQLAKIDLLELETVESDSVEGGLAMLRDRSIDVCLVDYRLGGDNAADFISRAREEGHRTPVIVISGLARRELQEALPSTSLTHFVKKEEISPLLLELTLSNAIEHGHEHAAQEGREEPERDGSDAVSGER